LTPPDERKLCAFAGKRQGNGAANAGTGAGNESYFVLEARHGH
jgi:hypothetical protein